MSQFQQIRVRVDAHYAKGLAADFPALRRQAAKLGNDLLAAEPPLIELVPLVVRLGLDPHVEPAVRQIAGRFSGRLEHLGRQVHASVADWRLAAAELALGQMDELFVELESALAELA